MKFAENGITYQKPKQTLCDWSHDDGLNCLLDILLDLILKAKQ